MNPQCIITRTMRIGQVNCRWILLVFLFVLGACTSHSQKRPSILIVAVDSLSVNDINCGQDSEASPKSGFSILCNESVRFTHAFTPSVLSQPAVASLLTGLYPFEHNVRTNSGKGLIPEIKTSSELAVQEGYRTIFFSGGAPVLRKSGLQKGFEIFEDNLNLSTKLLFRPFYRNIEMFNYWLDAINSHSPFFSFFYVPDLNFPLAETVNEYGELRTNPSDNQIEELNESLFSLIKNLKEQNKWDSTWFVLVGLNGHPLQNKPEDWASLNLASENTRVALFIKPPTKSRDMAMQWKSDTPISTADVGATVFDILGAPLKNTTIDSTHSLTTLLQGNEASWQDQRALFSESGWWSWRGGGQVRIGVRVSNYLYIYDRRPLVFNALVDRYEQTPLPKDDVNFFEVQKKAMALPLLQATSAFVAPNSIELTKSRLGYEKWNDIRRRSELVRDLDQARRKHPQDDEIASWIARLAIEDRNWGLLKRMGEQAQNPHWLFVSKKNDEGNGKISWPTDSCWNLFSEKTPTRAQIKTCDDGLVLNLLAWVRAPSETDRDAAREKFIRDYLQMHLDQKILETNASLGWIWDTKLTKVPGPQTIDLVLSLPEMDRYREIVKKRVVN